jgi:hypothetical protein
MVNVQNLLSNIACKKAGSITSQSYGSFGKHQMRFGNASGVGLWEMETI